MTPWQAFVVVSAVAAAAFGVWRGKVQAEKDWEELTDAEKQSRMTSRVVVVTCMIAVMYVLGAIEDLWNWLRGGGATSG